MTNLLLENRAKIGQDFFFGKIQKISTVETVET